MRAVVMNLKTTTQLKFDGDIHFDEEKIVTRKSTKKKLRARAFDKDHHNELYTNRHKHARIWTPPTKWKEKKIIGI